MKLYPINAMEFQDTFPTDQACYEYLCLVKWPNGFVCPYCQYTQCWIMKDHARRCKRCRKTISVIAGTIFQGLRKPLRVIFQALWYMVCQKQGVSALGLQKILGLGSYETAWSWLHKFRRAMVRPGRDRLSGTIEIDETLVGGAKSGKRGRGAEGKELVLVAVEKTEKGIGRVRLKHIPDAAAALFVSYDLIGVGVIRLSEQISFPVELVPNQTCDFFNSGFQYHPPFCFT